MYLAPLNYDRFFQKVFSDTEISKKFLEDFPDIETESLETMAEKHKITDDAAFVEFDFRCRIRDTHVIITNGSRQNLSGFECRKPEPKDADIFVSMK